MLPAEAQDECDHDWKLADESFSHEFGTEVDVFWECKLCGKTKECGPHDFELYDDLTPEPN